MDFVMNHPVLAVFLTAAAVFVAVLLVRAALFRPKAQVDGDDTPVEFDREAAVAALAALIRCRTVSCNDPAMEDDGEFRKLIDSLPALYPRVFDICSVYQLPDRALLLRWPGRRGGDPTVLME